MITSFFKPKSTQKVTPEPSEEAFASTVSIHKKRTFHDDKEASNKRAKTNNDASVLELISYLKDSNHTKDTDYCHTWKHVLEKHFATPSFSRLANFVSTQRKSHKVYPPAPDTFAALNWTPLDQVKVVIVGQDPYHGPEQAHGLCFSVKKGIRTPPSLRNIYKELIDDSLISNFTSFPTHGNLERWTKQGVLMINTVLTVRQGEPNSHKGKGWELVTDEILRAVDRRAKQKVANGDPGGVVYLLWGKPAADKCQTALGMANLSSSGGIQSHRKIICTSHPSPLGATKTNSPFIGSKCFSKANAALTEFGYNGGIDWRVDGESEK